MRDGAIHPTSPRRALCFPLTWCGPVVIGPTPQVACGGLASPTLSGVPPGFHYAVVPKAMVPEVDPPVERRLLGQGDVPGLLAEPLGVGAPLVQDSTLHGSLFHTPLITLTLVQV